jgi:LMBR1 domain-containing protein 1
MFINNLDRLLNSNCGFTCGYIMDNSPSYFNPLDSLLQLLSARHESFYNIQLFLDTVLFVIILLYTFICILYGIVKIGINFFSLEIYRLRRRDTMPQALSIVSILVILMMFAFSMQLMSIAPMYVTFGDQRVNGESGEKCTLKESQISHKSMSEGHVMNVGFGCQMTMIAQLYTKIQLSLPAFTICYFMLSWAFILAFAVFLAYHGHYKTNYLAHQLAGYSQLNGNDEEQDEDLQLFMKTALKEDNPALAQRIKNDRMIEHLEGQCWDNQSSLSSLK